MDKKLLLLSTMAIFLLAGQSCLPVPQERANEDGESMIEEMEEHMEDGMGMMDKEFFDKMHEDGSVSEDSMMMDLDEMEEQMFADDDFMLHGHILDVTDGEEVSGVNTGGNAFGEASSGYNDGMFMLKASFVRLPDPGDGFFYEGWLVNLDEFNVISTGELRKEGDMYIDEYVSERDYTDHKFYVLTIEPDDGDPAPAAHIAEGHLEEEVH